MSLRINADVVVIGAGLSGLSCARRLLDAGLEPVVLEAQTRVGGRTLTQSPDPAHPEWTFDFGAQWLGPTQSRMRALAREFGIGLWPTKKPGKNAMEADGQVSTYHGTIPKLAFWALLDIHFGLRKMEAEIGRFPIAEPTSVAEAAALDSHSVASALGRYLRTGIAKRVFSSAMRVVFGAEPEEVGLLGFLYYMRQGGGFTAIVETEGGAQQDRIVGGAQTFSWRMAGMLGDRVKLGVPVRRIEQDGPGVVVVADGLVARGRFAVVAVPPHMAGRIEYKPGLPPRKDRLFQAMPMGATTKALAVYERPFWRDAGLSGEGLFTGGPLSVCFDNSLPNDAPAALVGFMVGQHARIAAEQPAQERRQAVLAAFARLFGEAALKPVVYMEKDWAADEWARGCPAASFPAGHFLAYQPALATPCGRIHWAGTETAREWTGYMEGAVEAGERAADEIIARRAEG